MSTDLHDLLESAAAAPPAFDAEAVVDRGLRQRRVRAWTRAGAAGLVVAAVAGALILSLPRPRVVDLVGPSAAPSWPIAVRYEDFASESGNERTILGEFAASGWNDWLHVVAKEGALGTEGGLNSFVERLTPEDGYRSAEALIGHDEPFTWLESAASARLRLDDSQAAPGEMAPSPLLHFRFGARPEPRADRVILADDLPELRQQVADRLGLDPDVLDSVRHEHDAHDITGGRQQHTYVWIPALRLPLYVEEIDPNGDRFTMRVTHLREGIAPPPAAD
jgi:hypothetical protein